MPKTLTGRLDTDEDFRKNLQKCVSDYIKFAKTTLDYYTADFDAAHDVLMCYATLAKKDYIKVAKGHPRRFILPMTATHVHTMSTFLANALFGSGVPHKVDPGGPDDDHPAVLVNSLLEWNAEQQQAGMFQLGFMWVENALVYNRGVAYDCVQPIFRDKWETQEQQSIDENGTPILDPATLQPVMESVEVKTRTRVGDYCRIELVSPYDFYVDPQVPLYRMQEGRFAGHRMQKTWVELFARTKLDPDDPMYLSPRGMQELKKKPNKGLSYPSASDGTSGSRDELTSRTMYERTKAANPTDGRADSKDPGNVDFVELWVKLVPADYEIDDRTEPQVFQITVGNDREVLSVTESTYEHGMFPYSVMEPRPSSLYQYAPSWVMLLKNLQDYTDYLKNRHQEAITRTIGNVFAVKSQYVDIQDFEDPDKEGKIINILPEAGSMSINDIIKQIPVVDTTANFLNEMRGFVNFAESASGASSQMQGQPTGADTATAAAIAAQSGSSRMGTVAKLLSVQAIVPQTRRIVSNFQQFYDGDLHRRITAGEFNMGDAEDNAVQITPDSIQGSFNFRPHDGTLPGPDAKKTAAAARIIELMAMPQFAAVTKPEVGNIDPRKVFFDLIRGIGGKPELYRYTQNDINRMAQQMAADTMAQAQVPSIVAEAVPGMMPQPGQPAQRGGAEPSTAVGLHPGPKPATPSLYERKPENLGPRQARPANTV